MVWYGSGMAWPCTKEKQKEKCDEASCAVQHAHAHGYAIHAIVTGGARKLFAWRTARRVEIFNRRAAKTASKVLNLGRCNVFSERGLVGEWSGNWSGAFLRASTDLACAGHY